MLEKEPVESSSFSGHIQPNLSLELSHTRWVEYPDLIRSGVFVGLISTKYISKRPVVAESTERYLPDGDIFIWTLPPIYLVCNWQFWEIVSPSIQKIKLFKESWW